MRSDKDEEKIQGVYDKIKNTFFMRFSTHDTGVNFAEIMVLSSRVEYVTHILT